jgi:uncharacterized protein (TIGR03578 family)
MIEFQKTITCTGLASSKKAAFSAALSQVQAKMIQECPQVLLKIEPVDIQVQSLVKHSKTEKFLFFFLPRQIESYQVVLNITVKVLAFEIDNIAVHSKFVV